MEPSYRGFLGTLGAPLGPPWPLGAPLGSQMSLMRLTRASLGAPCALNPSQALKSWFESHASHPFLLILILTDLFNIKPKCSVLSTMRACEHLDDIHSLSSVGMKFIPFLPLG